MKKALLLTLSLSLVLAPR
uniref:Truncated OipA n=1 Tax=Helicobacter pylori TaxID=210 RepID=G8EG58_HELPX|nr:truncated OipA [Helicobacter pylori]AER59575.1 truncated OipA [Helicobacter pylori]